MNDTRIFSVQRSGANLPMGPEFEDPASSFFTEMSTSGQQLSVMDGVPHSDLRRYFSDTFSRKGVDGLEHMVRTITPTRSTRCWNAASATFRPSSPVSFQRR
ncbi:MAG: hypothetical protein WDN04_19945 [Rhodospirillales bacterium]